VLTLAVVAPAAASMKILEPHDPTWERIFKISWQTDEKKGRPVVAGTGRSVPGASLFVRPDRRPAGTPIPLSRQAWSQA